jgi:Rrf2 family protein
MKSLSKKCVYGIRAVLYLTALDLEKPYVHIRQISKDLHIPLHFLTKIFQILSDHTFIHSRRGPNGGVSLGRPANKITIMELINASDGTDFFQERILGLSGCGQGTPCPLRISWREIQERIKSISWLPL